MNFYLHQVIFVLCYFSAFISAKAQIHPIEVKIESKQIKANEPFQVTFIVHPTTANNPKNTIPKEHNPFLKDFVVVSMQTSSEITYSRDSMTNTYKYIFVLIPKSSGEHIIFPWSTKSDDDIFLSDTFRIHVENSFISSKDSVKKIETINKNINKGVFNPFGDNPFIPTIQSYKPDGVSFNHPDSIYHAKTGKLFNIVYSLSFVNMANISSLYKGDIIKDATICPEGLYERQVFIVTNNSTTINYYEYTQDFIVQLIASDPGTYSIPPVGFTYKDKKYTSKEIKIIVE